MTLSALVTSPAIFSATATSGSGDASKFGVAGSFALNAITETTEATINAGATVTGIAGGNILINAAITETDTAHATSEAQGGKVGVGASLAFNILAESTTRAEIEDGASLTATSLGTVTLSASSTRTVSTTVEAGSEGGSVAVTPAVSLALDLQDHATARIGSGTGTLTGGGLLNVQAVHTADFTDTKADAGAAGDKVGVGAGVGIVVMSDWATAAEVARNVTAGNVQILATSSITSATQASASKKGGDKTDKKANEKTDDQIGSNDNLKSLGAPTTNNSDTSGGNANNSASGQSGTNSKGSSVGISAAVAVDVVSASNSAGIGNNAQVHATSGSVKVSASANVDANAKADATQVNTDGGGVDIGAAFSLNDVSITNTATVGSGADVTGNGITVEAITPDTDDISSRALAVAGNNQGDVSVSGVFAINVIDTETKAQTADGSHLHGGGGAIDITARNDLKIQALAAAAALSGSGVPIAAAVAVNVVGTGPGGSNTTASIGNPATDNAPATVDGTGAVTVSAQHTINPLDVDLTGLPDFIKDNVHIPLTSLAIAGGGSNGGNKPAFAGSADINIYDTTTHALVDKNATVGQSGAPNASLTVSATDTTVVKSAAGTLSVSVSGSGIGAGLDLAKIDKDTRAFIGQGAHVKTTGLTSVTATSSEDLLSISANAGIGGNAVGISGSASVEIVTTATRAYIDSSAQVTETGGVNIDAGGTLGLTLVAGAVGAGNSGAGGAALTTLVHNDTVEAFIGNGATVTTSAGGSKDIVVNAHSTETEVAIGAAGGLSGGFGIAGSVVVNILNETTRAFVDRSSTVNASGNLKVYADDQSKIVSVAGTFALAGGSAGVGVGADVGAVTKRTEAFIESNVHASTGGNIDIRANSFEQITSIAAGVALSSGAAINVDADVHVLNVTTRAFIGDDPDFLYGSSTETIDTGDDSAGEGNVHATGSISISADEHTTLNAITGSLSGGSSAAITAGATVTVTNKRTEAFIGKGAQVTADGSAAVDAATGILEPVPISAPANQGDINPSGVTGSESADSLATQGQVKAPALNNSDLPTVDDGNGGNARSNPGTSSSMLNGAVSIQANRAAFTGISISARNYDQINGLTAGIAVSGGAGIGLSAVVNALNNDTEAYVNHDAVVTGPTVKVGAANDFHHLAVGATVAVGGEAGVGPAVDVSVINNTTKAELRSGSTVTATSGDITVDANGKEDILLIGIGVAGGTVGFGAGVSVLVVDNTTRADIAGTADAHGNVVVRASDATDITIVDGGAGGGLVGVGASVGVISLDKTTEAYIDNGAIIHARALGGSVDALAGTLKDGNDASGFDTTTAKGLVVEATSREKVFHLNVALGGGFVGIAGGVTVTTLHATTHAWIGAADVNFTDNDSSGADQAVFVNAADEARVVTFAGGVAGGLVGVAGAVDIGVLRNNTKAEIQSGARVVTKKSVAVNAMGIKEIDAIAASGAGGAVGLTASVSVWSVGDKLNKNYSNEDDSKNENAGDHGGQTSEGYAAQQGEDGSNNVGSVINGGGDQHGITNGATNPNAATNADDRKAAIAYQGLSGQGGFSTEKPDHTSLGNSLGGAVEAGTTASITGTAQVTATTGNINVNAVENLHFDGTQGGVGAGIAGLGAGVGVINIASNVKATAGGTLSAGGAINVHANLFEDIDELAFAGGAGVVGLGAAVGVVNDTSTVESGISNNATIYKASAIDVLAHGDQHVKGLTVGVQLGLAAAGASFVKIDVDNGSATEVNAYVGTGVNIAQDANDSVGQLSVTASSDLAGAATAFGLSVGILAAQVNFAFVDANPNVIASIGDNSHINVGGNIHVDALARPEGDARTTGVSVGAAALGASISHANLNPNVQAFIRAADTRAGDSIEISGEVRPADGVTPNYQILSSNPDADTVHVEKHGLVTGDIIQFSGSGTHLQDGRLYSVIVTSTDDLSFGAKFKGQTYTTTSGVDIATSTIHFSAAHNFQDGDVVRYVAGTSPITGLVDGTDYYVIVVDGRTIRLATYDPTGTNHNLTGFAPTSGTTLTASGTNYFEGEAVTYHAPATTTFSSLQVDVDPNNLVNGAINVKDKPPLNDSSSGDNIQFVNTTEGDPNEGHPVSPSFADQDRVQYSAGGIASPVAINGLVSGGTYKVVHPGSSTIQLGNDVVKFTQSLTFANGSGTTGGTITRASGTWAGDGYQDGQQIEITGGTNAGIYTITILTGTQVRVNQITFVATGALVRTVDAAPLALTPDKSSDNGRATVHSLIKLSDLPMTYFDGLNDISMDNKTFYVRNPSGDTFSLALTPGGTVLNLTARLGATGNHLIGPENIGLRSTGSGDQTLRIDLVDPVAPSGKLLGPGGVPLNVVSPPSGDGSRPRSPSVRAVALFQGS